MSIASIGKPAAIVVTKPRLSANVLRGALRAIGVLAFIAWSAWIAYEAVADQNEQQTTHDFQLGDRP